MNKNQKRIRAILKDHRHNPATKNTALTIEVPRRDYDKGCENGKPIRAFVSREI